MKKLIIVIVVALFSINVSAQWSTYVEALTMANSEILAIVQGGVNKKITKANFIGDTTVVSSVVKMLSDTSLYHAFVIGSGNANDTTLFSTGDAYGIKWDGSHNLVITKVTAVNGSASKDIDIALLHDVNYKDATPTAVLSADLTITSNTAGDDATSFASATIAPGQWLWVRIDQSTTPPLQTIINVYGYLTEL